MSVFGQDVEDVFGLLPDVVTDLVEVDAEEFLDEGSAIGLSDQDTVYFEVLESSSTYLRYKQTYSKDSSAQFFYEVRMYERIREEGHVVAVSRQVGTGDDVWQRDFQLFEYTEEGELQGVAPLVRVELLRYSAPVVRPYSNVQEFTILVDLNPREESVSGFTFTVVRSEDSEIEEEFPIKWNGTNFSAR